MMGELAIKAVAQRCPGRVDLIASLHKVLILDSHLALEAYQRVREDAIVATATHDSLTELLSRAAAFELLTRKVERAGRFFRPMALLFIDVDHFMRINDSLGHAAGDTLLRRVAQTLQASVRSADIVGRYGAMNSWSGWWRRSSPWHSTSPLACACGSRMEGLRSPLA
jgi:predicted signal transduction protein with EAL and GGDEF domain